MPTADIVSSRPKPKDALATLERVVILGDLASLSSEERIGYYARVCESLGLNPLTRPFDYMSLNGKLTLYAKKDATDQLRKVNGISVTAIRRESDPELALQIVTVEGQDREGRTDSSIGVVSTKGLSGENLANALMKAETKAKRRMTLSLAGLGWLDESEVEDLDQPRERRPLLETIEQRTAELQQFAEAPETSDASEQSTLELPDEAPAEAATERDDASLPDIPEPTNGE